MKKYNIFLQVIIVSFFITAFLLIPQITSAQNTPVKITGLSDVSIFLDPGHAQKENMGLYNYSEAEKVLRVALELKNMLETQTDIQNVHMCRLTDDEPVTLSERTDLANNLGADFYYSIHSDAGSPSANSTLTMYGGYNNNGVTIEKTPNGGKAFGAILVDDLTGVMRISTRGNYADRIYYEGNLTTHTNQLPYLFVNRTTNMASLLSEAGFHTNPTQQQRNLNAEWKKIEALSAFRSFLELAGIDRPATGIVAGIITDEDTGKPVNGMQVTIGDQSYVTDSYETLFNKYSSDPEELSNGFYWLEGLEPGSSVDVGFSSVNYEAKNVNVSVVTNPNGRTAENITFLDVIVRSVVPAKVKQVAVTEGELTDVVPGRNILVSFTRKMDRALVEQAVGVSPAVEFNLSWVDDFTLSVSTDKLLFLTDYIFTIDGAVAKNLLGGQLFDGDGDGQEGGNYQFNISTSNQDVTAPQVVQQWPLNGDISNEIRPVIRVVFDEKLSESSIGTDGLTMVQKNGGAVVDGVVQHIMWNNQSVLHFFPSVDLTDNASYIVTIKNGLQDVYGNATVESNFEFTVNEEKITQITVMDDFESGIVSWWQPQASGSTSGIVTEQTSRTHDTDVTVKSIGSAGSMRINYEWATLGAGYIREHLPSSAAQNANKFDTQHVLQMYVFGDGSKSKFRYVIKDGDAKYEASDWYVLDWIGWKLISWDLTKGTSVAWYNGDGVLDGTGFYLDGIHMTSSADGQALGSICVDDLRFVVRQPYVPTGIDEFENIDIKVYPNPVKDQLYVETNEMVRQVELYDLTGRELMVQKADAMYLQVNVSDIKKGMYLLRIVTDAGTVSRKIQILN